MVATSQTGLTYREPASDLMMLALATAPELPSIFPKSFPFFGLDKRR